MILSEIYFVKKRKKIGKLHHRIDGYCFRAKNLHNHVTYLISQCHRISVKLARGKTLLAWEEELLTEMNSAVMRYNEGREGKKQLLPVSKDNGSVADAYFLSWYMKGMDVYKALPCATSAQICIQNVCSDWKSYYEALKSWKEHPEKFKGMPKKPGYLDKKKGRSPIVLTGQKVSINEDGYLHLPAFLNGIRIKPRHTAIRQVSILTDENAVRIRIMYLEPEKSRSEAAGVMGIDPGVNNLAAVSMDGDSLPVIINGRPLKSINQYYNKRRAFLQSEAKKKNRRFQTAGIQALTAKRNAKIKDYMHKASRQIINLALENHIGTIVIGRNVGWKQKVNKGNITNQNFVSVPFRLLIGMIRYKAELEGIRVIEINEAHTSGTSYLDGEWPDKSHYDISRRIHRGLFLSNTGKIINADVNAAYQIMIKAGFPVSKPREVESIRMLKVS